MTITTDNEVNMEHRIICAAEELFLEKGFALTSTTEIAAKAGCNQALIHYYFRTKENLFRNLFESKILFFAKTFFGVYKEELPFTQWLTIMIETHFDILEKNPKLPFLFLNEVTTNPQRLEAIRSNIGEPPSKMFLEFDRVLKEAINRKEIREISTINLMMNIASANLITFLAIPILSTAHSKEELDQIIKDRKEEVVKSVLLSLRVE